MERRYNPLSVDELGRNAARAVMDYPAEPLPPPEAFIGPGVYTLHYSGPFSAYGGMHPKQPIYVGQAIETKAKRRPVYQRLTEHQRSIEEAENLDIQDFACRWLVLDAVWISMTEQILIEQYRPIWNTIVPGFGNHNQGGTRNSQERSFWDTLHPGRAWAMRQQDNRVSAADILRQVAAHRKQERDLQ